MLGDGRRLTMTDLRSIAFRSNRSRILLKPRGRSSESLGEYTLSIDYEHAHRRPRRTVQAHVGLAGPHIGDFYCWSFHGIYDAFLVA